MSDDLTVHLMNNATGEVRLVRGKMFDAFEYMWTEGNLSCDCNREIFFARAAGEQEPEGECSDGRFTAIKAILDSGEEMPLDDLAPPAEPS